MQSPHHWIRCLSVLLALASLGSASAQERPWSPSIPTGRDPVALVEFAGGVAVVSRSPSPEALLHFQSKSSNLQQKRTQTSSDVEKAVLGTLLADLDTVSTVTLYAASADGRLWPYREYLLYELRQKYIGERGKAEVTKYSGRATAAVRIRKGTTDFLLVATDDGVFELNLTTGALAVVEGLPQRVTSMAVGDLNGDGHQELVVVHSGNVTVYKVDGRGFGVWQTWRGQGQDLGYNPCFVAVADVNRDGAGDILVANDGLGERDDPTGKVETFRDSSVHVIISERTQFSSPTPYKATRRPRSLAIADFTGDGNLDVVAAGAEEVVLLEGKGDGTLGEAQTILRWEFPNELVPGTNNFRLPPATILGHDLDQDGQPDLLIADPASGRIGVVYGPLELRQPQGLHEIFVAKRPTALLVYDLEADTRPDLLVADGETRQVLALVQHRSPQRALPQFSPSDPRQGVVGPLAAAVGDQLLVAFAGPVLTEKRTDEFTLVSVSYPRPIGYPPDEETRLSGLQYTFYDKDAPVADLLVARGGAVAGTPTTGAESSDGSLAIVFDRAFTGTKADDNFPRLGAAGVLPRGVALGDLDSDGQPDVLVCFADGTLRAMQSPWPKRTTSRNITIPTLPANVSVAAVALADLDRQGAKNDLVVADRRTGSIYVLRNNRGSWERYEGSGVPSHGGLLASDIDGDGNVDLAVADTFLDRVVVFWGRGDGYFELNRASIPVGARPVTLAQSQTSEGAGSVLLVIHSGSDTVSVIAFTSREPRVTSFTLGKAGPVAAASGKSLDWLANENPDGHPDFVVACYESNELVLLRGKGGSEFEVVTVSQHVPLSNVVGTPVSKRGDGPQSVLVADLDGDGVEDVAFSVRFPTTRMKLDQARVAATFYAAGVKQALEALWESVFIYYSRRSRVEGPKAGGLAYVADVAVGREGGVPLLGVLHTVKDPAQPQDPGARKVSYFTFSSPGGSWQLVREVPVDPGVTRVALLDLNADNRLDLVTLDTRKSELTISWGGESRRTTLPAPPGSATLAIGASSEGTWLTAGSRLWLARPPQLRFDERGYLALELGEADTRDALAIPGRGGAGPPDLVALTTRNEVRVFSGRDLLAGRVSPSLTVPAPPGFFPTRVIGGYFDRDGTLDLALASVAGADAIQLRMGTGTFRPLGNREYASGCALGVGDFDQDGIDDLVVLSYSPGTTIACVRLFAGRGDGGFTLPSSLWLRAASQWKDAALLVADVDGDRCLDVVAWDRSGSEGRVFLLCHQDVESEITVGTVHLVAKRLELDFRMGY